MIGLETDLNQPNCDSQTMIDSNSGNNYISMASVSPIQNRYTQSVSNQVTSSLQAVAQPYPSEPSNFGPFYHHHHHHNHISSYGNPYDKFKYPGNIHSRSPNSSPYGGYQSFYPTNTHHHHPHPHQMIRPSGYIDLVPR